MSINQSNEIGLNLEKYDDVRSSVEERVRICYLKRKITNFCAEFLETGEKSHEAIIAFNELKEETKIKNEFFIGFIF